MTAAVVLILVALALAGIALGARRATPSQLMAWRLRLPAGLSADEVATWLATVTAGGTSRARLPQGAALGLEVVAQSRGIEIYLVTPENRRPSVLASLRAALPGVRVEDAAEHLRDNPVFAAVATLRTTSRVRPLAVERAEATVAAFIASLQPLRPGEQIRTSYLFIGTATPLPSTPRPRQQGTWSIPGAPARVSAEARRAERLKFSAPLLQAVGRVGVVASTPARARQLLGQVTGTLAIMDAADAKIRPHQLVPARWASWSFAHRRTPLLAWPLMLNTREAVGIFGLAVANLHLPGLRVGAARQLPPSNAIARTGSVVGMSNYPGLETTPIALKRRDRLRHVWALGPTGTGKSTLLANLAIQDMARGDAVIVVDVLGDMVPTVMAGVPADRRNDVILIDPATTDVVTGWNILAGVDRELSVDHIEHAIHDLNRNSWGPRMSDTLRAALLSLAYAKAPNGSAFALTEIAPLLTDVRFRNFVTSQSSLPVGLGEFWGWFERLSDANRAEVIAPVLNKLRGFSSRTPLRLLLGQSRGIDLAEVFTKRKILLVRLSKGQLGEETARLIGSLLVASIWLTALGRSAIDPAKRRPVWLYLDEFQETVRLPLGLTDLMSQARGLGLGLTLANQYLHQLPEPIRAAVLGTVQTQIVFQTGYDDAQTLARSFAPLTRDDLMHLERYEVAVRPHVDGQTMAPVTATTVALPPVRSDAREIAGRSRERYGVPAVNVDAAIKARIDVTGGNGPIGRTRRGDRS